MGLRATPTDIRLDGSMLGLMMGCYMSLKMLELHEPKLVMLLDHQARSNGARLPLV